MTTETDFKIEQVEYDGITTWWAKGQIPKDQFLLAALEQFNEAITKRVKDACRVPQMSDVTHFFGMPTVCMDDAMCAADMHDEICEDPSTCDFELQRCYWTTYLDDDSFYEQTA